MNTITENLEAEVLNKEHFFHVVNVCCKDKNSSLNQDDAFKRYIGYRKSTVVYNNSNSKIVVCIKAGSSCFINNCRIGKIINLGFKCFNRNPGPLKIILLPKTYQKLLVPTKNFILTVCIKVEEEEELPPIQVTPSPEPLQSPENNHFNAFMNYAGNIIGRSEKRNRPSN